MKTIQDLKENLLYSKNWDRSEQTNYQETHIHCVLNGKKIYAQYICVNEYGGMYDCNIFTNIPSKGFKHLFECSDWLNISLIQTDY